MAGRSSIIPPSRLGGDLSSQSVAEGVPVASMAGLIVDNGNDYAAHDSDDDTEPVEQTIDEYIALLQQQRLEELGGDGDDVANNLLKQVLGDGSLGDDDEDDEKDSKTDSGSFGGMIGSMFGRKANPGKDEDDDEDDDDIHDTTESNVCRNRKVLMFYLLFHIY